jgi:hypothetical protein
MQTDRFTRRAIVDEGERPIRVFYVGPYKLHMDPEEGSVSCECKRHAEYVLDPIAQPRCTHSAAVWRLIHEGGLLG